MCVQSKRIKRLLVVFTSSTGALDFRRFMLNRAGRIACSSSRAYPGHSVATGRVAKFGQALTEESVEGCPKRGDREGSSGIFQLPYESTPKIKAWPTRVVVWNEPHKLTLQKAA